MNMEICCGFLPSLIAPEKLENSIAVVIDVLRATTTIAHALSSGCEGVTPFIHIPEAFDFKAKFSDALLGGERKGLRIEGFDLGNSPAEYGPNVSGRRVGITTTNGTLAIHRCAAARRILTASFANLSATCSFITSLKPVRVCLVCAGTDGEVTREDVLCAGALASRLGGDGGVLDDQARLALDAWRSVGAANLQEELSRCLGGRNLIALGLGADLSVAGALDSLGIATALDTAGVIRRVDASPL